MNWRALIIGTAGAVALAVLAACGGSAAPTAARTAGAAGAPAVPCAQFGTDLRALWAADTTAAGAGADQAQIQDMDSMFTGVGYYPPGSLAGDEVAFYLDTTPTGITAIPGQDIQVAGRLPADIANLATDCGITP